MTAPTKYRRRRKLIQPGLQLRMTLTFMGISALSLLLQYVLFANAVTNLALELPRDGALVMERAGSMLGGVLGVSFLVFLPLTFAIGVLSTFRIAGPIYRFKGFLTAIQRGEQPADFRLRKGDELQDLAQLLNDATRPLRAQQGHSAEQGGDEEPASLVASGAQAPAAQESLRG